MHLWFQLLKVTNNSLRLGLQVTKQPHILVYIVKN